ncbi:MAG TPA: hypothetical protein VKS24_03485 [Bradyrhizobium sp.]|nr:hypothetical protein [Bradyrhizobium sp.]
MLNFLRSAGAFVLFGAVLLPPAQAMAFDLSGAWATDAGLCSQVFTKKGNEVEFAELSDLFGSGFIIEGSRIRGKSGRCTITSRKQDGDSIELAAACASSVMTQNLNFSLKVIDDNSLSRLFPDIPGMTLKYVRCAPLKGQ